MEQQTRETEAFSIVRRAKSFTHAWRGITVFIRTTHNAWVEVLLLVFVVIAGFYFDITAAEWTSLILAGGLVLTVEAINTAIEIDIDLTSPQYHPYARDTKDVAAGAVLIAGIMAIAIGLIIFVPHLLALIR